MDWWRAPSLVQSHGTAVEVTLATILVTEENGQSEPETDVLQAIPQPPQKSRKKLRVRDQSLRPLPVRPALAAREPVRSIEPAYETSASRDAEQSVDKTSACISPDADNQEKFETQVRSREASVVTTTQLVEAASPADSTTPPGFSKSTSTKDSNKEMGRGRDAIVEAQPLYWRNPAPEYPLQALRQHWEGVVWLIVQVNAEGSVETLNVEKSSGYSVLDRSAQNAVRNWTFLPARRAGLPVGCQVRVPVRFKLDNG